MTGEQDFEGNHGAGAALRTSPGVTTHEDGGEFAALSGWRQKLRTGVGQTLPAEIQLLGAVAVGQESVVTDALKAGRQGVQQETANELVRRNGHHFGALWVAIVFPTKRNL